MRDRCAYGTGPAIGYGAAGSCTGWVTEPLAVVSTRSDTAAVPGHQATYHPLAVLVCTRVPVSSTRVAPDTPGPVRPSANE